MSSAPTAPAMLRRGKRLAGVWVIDRLLEEVGGVRAALAQGIETGRALIFVLSEEAPDPPLHDEDQRRWGAVRRVLRDPDLGRIVVDEIPEGSLLVDRLALGAPPAAGLVDDLTRRVRESHRHSRAHGQLAPDRIVLAAEGAVAAGWGLGVGDIEQRKAQDQAALACIAGQLAPRSTAAPCIGAVADAAIAETAPTAPTPKSPPSAMSSHRLQAAIQSSHLPTLRGSLTEWLDAGGAADDPVTLRAKDALARLERKVAEGLAEARQRLAHGDPLGAVAPCREAIRLGAEGEAEPLLRAARRQARQLVGARRLPPWRTIAIYGAGAAVAALLLLAGVVALRPSGAEAKLREDLERLARTKGERAALLELLSRRESGEAPALIDASLRERLPTVVAAERERLTRLHREAVAAGARPREADRLAEDALARLTELTRDRVDDPAFAVRLTQAFLVLDQAALRYRGSAGISVAEAARAAELLLAQDPLFAAGAATRP